MFRKPEKRGVPFDGAIRRGYPVRMPDEEQVEVVEQTFVHVPDTNKLEVGVRGEEDVWSDPVRRLPIPLCIGAADELAEIRTPSSEI